MKDLSYEKSLEKLEDILEKLEDGNFPLEEHLKLFEEAVELHNNCTKILSKTEKAVELILENGEIIEKDFNLEV